MSDQAALEAFLDKWRARWPEWRIAEAFVPAPQRAATLAWLALRQELADAAWEGADPRPGAAKLAWWSDELHGWAQGRRRHPLGLALQRMPAPWDALAAALPALAAARGLAIAEGDGIARLQATIAPFAQAGEAVSAAIAAEGQRGAAPAAHDAAGAGALSASLAAALAAAGGTGSQAAAQAVLAAWPRRPGGARADRIFAALASRRLRNPAPSWWHSLWAAWCAGRSIPSA